MFTAYVVAVHVAGLALAVAGVVRAGDRPQVLLYAFILEYALRLATVFAIVRALAARDDSLLARLAPIVCRPPAPTAESQPIRHEGSRQAAGPGTYALTIAFLAFLVVVLGNVNADRELDLDAARFGIDLQWASLLALVYWVQSLLDRTTIVDPRARWDVNVGYNTRELTILAVSVLVAGLVVVVRQANDLPASGWTVLGPLFAFRFLFDLWGALHREQPAPGRGLRLNSALAAKLYGALVLVVVAFQLALAAGAPWGSLAMGGAFPGQLPPAMRVAAVVQALVLVVFAAIVAARGGVFLPGWSAAAGKLIWLVVGLSVVSVVLNAITPSTWERVIWLPVALVLLACAVAVARGPGSRPLS